jgi:hypothetical protein
MTARHRREVPPVHPLQRADDPPPPQREQLPLPQREQQAHLEPQLRVPGSPGTGTPFAPFGPEQPGRPPVPRGPGRIAAFHDATRRRRAEIRRLRAERNPGQGSRGNDRPSGEPGGV